MTSASGAPLFGRLNLDYPPGIGGERDRSEARLVLDFADHSQSAGHHICAHDYDLGDITLRNDLATSSLA